MPGVSTDITVTNAAPATVAFVTPPLDVDTGQPINAGLNPAGVSVSVLDAYGNPVLDSQPVVTMALAASSNPGKLTGTTAVQAVAGVATFKDLSIDAGGTSYALDASLEGSAPVASAPFNVGVGAAPTHLVFTQMATSIVPDGGNLPKIVVSVEDTNGHVVQDDNTTQVTIKLAIPAGGLGGNLYGVLTEPVQNGVAVFDKLYIQQVAIQGKTSTSFNLVASSTNHTSLATATTSFDVGVGAPASFIITQGANQPNLQAGQPLQPITIQLVDSDGNHITKSPAMNVSFGVLPNGSGAIGSTNPIQQINVYVNGSNTPQLYDTLPLVNGTATFTSIAIRQPNLNYVFAIGTTDYNLPAVLHQHVQRHHRHDRSPRVPEQAAELVLQHGDLYRRRPGTPLQVALEDSSGNILTSDSSTIITLTADTSMVPPPTAVTLQGEGFESNGTVQLQVSKGVAFFNRVLFATTASLTQGYSGYQITASAGGKTVTSDPSNCPCLRARPPPASRSPSSPRSRPARSPTDLGGAPRHLHRRHRAGEPVRPVLSAEQRLERHRHRPPATSLNPADGNITVNFADDLSTSAAGTFRLGAVVKVGGAFAISDPSPRPLPACSRRR